MAGGLADEQVRLLDPGDEGLGVLERDRVRPLRPAMTSVGW
ncbi:hypothetical protein [Actinomadura macra]|nr:hypothetical protein [Actinomadura macra]